MRSSIHGSFLAAAALSSSDVTAARKRIEDLHLRGQRRIHFKDESAGRKRRIVDALVTVPIAVRLYEPAIHRHELAAREACLRRIVNDLVGSAGARLVIELDDSVLKHDRKTLFSVVAEAGLQETLEYHHLRATEDPLLAVPDAIAWCWSKGGD